MTTEQLLAEFAFNCNLAIVLIIGMIIFVYVLVTSEEFIRNIPNLWRKFKVRVKLTKIYTVDEVLDILNKNIAPIEYRAKHHFGLKYVKSVKIRQSVPDTIFLTITGEYYHPKNNINSEVFGHLYLPTKNERCNVRLCVWLNIDNCIYINDFENFLNSIKTILDLEEKK